MRLQAAAVMLRLLLVALAACALATSSEQHVDSKPLPLPHEVVSFIKAAVARAAGPAEDFGSSVEDAAHGVLALFAVGQAPGGRMSSAVCALVKGGGHPPAQPWSASGALLAHEAGAALGCPPPPPERAVLVAVLQAPPAGSETLGEWRSAARLLDLMGGDPIPAAALAAAASRVDALADDDGAFRHSEASLDASAEATGLALELMASLSRLGLAAGGLPRGALRAAGELLSGPLALEGPGGAVALADQGGRPCPAATAGVLAGLAALEGAAAGVLAPVNPGKVAGMARYLLAGGRAAGARGLHDVGRGLRAVCGSALPRPLFARVASPALRLASESPLAVSVSVSDPLGGAPPAGTRVTAVKASGPEGVAIAGPRELEGAGGGDFSLALPEAASWAPGPIEVALEVAPPGPGGAAGTWVFRSAHALVVVGAVRVGEGRAWVAPTGEAAAAEAVAPPGALPAGTRLGEKDTMHAEVEVHVEANAAAAAYAPHQAVLRLRHAGYPRAAAFFPAAAGGAGGAGGALTAQVTLQGIREQLLVGGAGAVGGQYLATFLVGDEAMEGPAAAVDLGLLEVADAAGSFAPPSAARPAVKHGQPEIHHLFKEAEARPAVWVSLAFSAAALAPLAWLLSALSGAGSNLRALPALEARGRVAALGLLAGLASISGVLALAWWRLTLLQALPLLAAAAAATTIAGVPALRALAEAGAAGKGGKAE